VEADSLKRTDEGVNELPLKITHRNEDEVPTPSSSGKVNEDLMAIKNEMQKLASGMVLEIEAGTDKAVRGTKMLVTKASQQLGARWRHWSVGSKVFAKPAGEIKKRMGRPRKTR
jgi:spore cortex formation protein SpoVR/YcgB (stage V sporulation)